MTAIDRGFRVLVPALFALAAGVAFLGDPTAETAPEAQDSRTGLRAEAPAPASVVPSPRPPAPPASQPVRTSRPRPGSPRETVLFDSLARVAASDADPRRRIAALRSMARMFGPKADPALSRGMRDPDPDVRRAAHLA